MKRISFLFLIVFLTSIVISSCSSGSTYAEQLKVQKIQIAAYIKQNKINVITKMPDHPKDWNWGGNDYVLTESGLYFHLVDSGFVTNNDTLAVNDYVVPRFKEYTLDIPSVLTRSDWSTIDYASPATFKFNGNTTETCAGFQEAAKYMKRNYSVAKLIIPSKIGFYTTDLTSATPYAYDLKILIQK